MDTIPIGTGGPSGTSFSSGGVTFVVSATGYAAYGTTPPITRIYCTDAYCSASYCD